MKGKARRGPLPPSRTTAVLSKVPTGIAGLDEITGGGLPQGRPTLVCGSAGSGKTLLAMEFLLRGATEFGEPGVFMSFEEDASELVRNFASLGHDLRALVARKELALDFVSVERGEIQETGEYDLEGLFIRLGSAIDEIGARRVVLDTIEALFSGLSNIAILRAELRRLFRWLKTKGVTAIITGERGENSLTRYGLEEYVADCVVVLDHRVEAQAATRRLRIVKYRGSTHGTNEYPFLIDEGGISILPVTSLRLEHRASSERVSSGIPRLDAMLEGKGFYRGASVMVSGTAGSGKTSVAAHFVRGAAARGERCLWFAFEESTAQILRNMRSIGVDLAPAVRGGLLRFVTERTAMFGLEMHLVAIHKLVREFEPHVVVIDPITNFCTLGSELEVKEMLTRLLDLFKSRQITALFTSLTSAGAFLELTTAHVSSLMDTWIVLRDMDCGVERNRVLMVLKSRGMAHSNQVREFLLTDHGVDLVDVYLGSAGELVTGSRRAALEAEERARTIASAQEAEDQNRELARKKLDMEAQVASLRAQLRDNRIAAVRGRERDRGRATTLAEERARSALRRQPDAMDGGRARKSGRG